MHDAPFPGFEPPPHEPPTAPGAARLRTDTVAAHHAKADRRPADTIWRANPREQGLIGVTDAIAYFGGIGWSVSMPLIDSQPYDLVVDDGHRLHRVQVKTTTHRTPYGIYSVQLCTNGGNQTFHTVKRFDPSSCELLYVLTDSRDRYLIPTDAIVARTALNLGAKVASYRIAFPSA